MALQRRGEPQAMELALELFPLLGVRDKLRVCGSIFKHPVTLEFLAKPSVVSTVHRHIDTFPMSHNYLQQVHIPGNPYATSLHACFY